MFKIVRDEEQLIAWQYKNITIILQNNNLFIVDDNNLNFEVSDVGVHFNAGSASDLKNAILSLTNKDDTEILATVTT